METIKNLNSFDDLVFNKRNQDYGAYKIRKSYEKNVMIGFGAAILVVATLVLYPIISNLFRSDVPKEVFKEKVVEITLKNPESLDEDKKDEIKEIKQPEAPKTESVKFTVPIVTEEEIHDITTIEDLNVSNPGNITQEGFEGLPGLENEENEELIGGTNTNEIFTVVEQMPEFPGGEDALNSFLDKNMQYPTIAREQGIQGKVWIGFIIDKFGNVSKVEVLRGIGGGCDEEAVRVVEMMPRWNPGKQSGRPVDVKFSFPIVFKLQ